MEIRTPPLIQGEFHADTADKLDVKHILATAARSGLLVEVPAYQGRPFKLKKSSPYNLDQRSVDAAEKIQETLGTTETVKDWEWASDKTGDQTMHKLLTLAQNRHKPAELDAIEALLLLADYLLSEPNINGQIIQEPPLDLEGIENTLIVRDSSAGKDLPGNPNGNNKRENAAWAIRHFMSTAQGRRQKAPYVHEPQPKGNEIIKKTKSQRMTFAQSTADFVTSQICTSGVVYRPNSLCSKSASSLTMGGNSGYQFLRLLTPDLPWEDCAKNPGAHADIVQQAWELLNKPEALAEEDKTEWEYNMDQKLKLILVLALLIMTDWRDKEHYLVPFLYSLASFLCPIIGIQGTLGIIAPHFMPSGNFWTLKINTGGHKLIVLSFKQKMLDEDEERALMWYKSVLLQGDDFISRNFFGLTYSQFADKKWGCITKAKFGTASEVRFLQRQLQMVDGQPRLAYDLERAKIKASLPRPEVTDHAEALKALVLATGSEELADKLLPHYLEMKVPRIQISEDGRCTDAAFFDKGVLSTFWSANEKLRKDVGTYFRLGLDYSMTPEYFDGVIRRAIKAQRLRK